MSAILVKPCGSVVRDDVTGEHDDSFKFNSNCKSKSLFLELNKALSAYSRADGEHKPVMIKGFIATMAEWQSGGACGHKGLELYVEASQRGGPLPH